MFATESPTVGYTLLSTSKGGSELVSLDTWGADREGRELFRLGAS